MTSVPGTDFGGAPNTARLAFSFVSPEEITEGVERLAGLAPVSVLGGRLDESASGRGTRRGCRGGTSVPRLCSRNVGHGRLEGEGAEPCPTEVAVIARQVVPFGHVFACLGCGEPQ